MLKNLPPGTLVQPKIDGSLVHVVVGRKPEILSHRVSQETGQHPVHTEKVWGSRPRINIPRKHHGKSLLSEVYGVRHGRAIPPQKLGGLLNANLDESLRRQKEGRIKLKLMPFDLSGSKAPYPERLREVKDIARYLPSTTLPEQAKTPKAAQGLFEKIRSGRHKLTREGVVAHPPHGKAIKIKNTEEANIRITGTYPGKGKYSDSHGGILYNGGRVGSGFSDSTRKNLHQYIGRYLRIKHQGKYKSGAYRAPSAIAIDETR